MDDFLSIKDIFSIISEKELHMRITESRLRQVIREVLNENYMYKQELKQKEKNKHIEQHIENFSKMPLANWRRISGEYIDMANGGSGDLMTINTKDDEGEYTSREVTLRDEHYSNWDDEDFLKVLCIVIINRMEDLKPEHKNLIKKKILS